MREMSRGISIILRIIIITGEAFLERRGVGC